MFEHVGPAMVLQFPGFLNISLLYNIECFQVNLYYGPETFYTNIECLNGSFFGFMENTTFLLDHLDSILAHTKIGLL